MKTGQRRGTLSAILIVLVAAVAVVPAAFAGGVAQQSHVVVEGLVQITDNSYEVFGGIESTTHKCAGGRTVELSAQAMPGDPYKPFDTATTSRKGAWAGAARGSSPNSIKATVTKSKVGPRGNRTTCGSDTEKFTPDK